MQYFPHVKNGSVIQVFKIPDGEALSRYLPLALAADCVEGDETVRVGDLYDGKTFAAPVVPPPTKEQLMAYAADKRWRVETGGIVIEGTPIATDRESQSMISSAFQVASVTGQTIKFKSGGGFVELSPEQMQGIALTVAAHVQASFAAEAAVIAKIQAGEITNTEQIGAYVWPDGAA